MSEEKRGFVNVETYLQSKDGASWADEPDDDADRGEVKSKKTAWNTVTEPVEESNFPSLVDIQAEQGKASETAAKKAPYRPPLRNAAPSPTYDLNPVSNFEYSHADQRTPQPIPTEPPFTAFVGNLSYDVNEEALEVYFGELGLINVRLMKDPSGNSKGFGYLEFKSAESLEMALKANGAPFTNGGRKLNVDVAKPPNKSNTSWGPGNRDRDSNREQANGNRSSYRSDNTSWGPGNRDRDSNRPNYSSSSRPPGSNYNNNNNNSKPPAGDRPKLNLNPPTQKTEPVRAEPVKPKGSHENPFGTAFTDVDKMNKLSQERVQRELEREALKKKEEDQRRSEQEKNRPPKFNNTRGEERESWRNNQSSKAPTPWGRSRDNPVSPRGQEDAHRGYSAGTGNGNERRARPPVVDSDGFQQSGRRGWEVSGSGSAARVAQSEAQSKQNSHKQDLPLPTKTDNSKPQNRYEGLEEEDT